jgi:hypothetical protein
MFESRCGVCCSVCQLKDKLNCNECKCQFSIFNIKKQLKIINSYGYSNI